MLYHHLLFDIHNTQNNGISPEAQLDQIETAILKHQTQKAVDLMTGLNEPSIKLNFSTVQTEGENLLRIQDAFENQLNEEEAND